MVRYSSILFSIIFCLTVTLTAQSQDNRNAKSEDTLVRFDLYASKADSSSDFMDLPTQIMDKLVEHDALDASDIRYLDKTYQVDAEFAFSSMQKFRDWYNSKKAKNLFNTFREDFDRLELGFQIVR